MIESSLPRPGETSLIVYNLRGEEVFRLVDGYQPAGTHAVIWDASTAAPGIYFYRLETSDFVQARKMLLLK